MASPSQHERFSLHDRAALARCAAELGVAIPWSDDLSILFTPLEIAGHGLSNRFAVQPMEGCDAEADGTPGPLTLRRYRRFAAGGSGLIWFEATAATAEGRANPHQLWITAANVGAFRRLVEQTRAAAKSGGTAGHELLLILQLTHSGRYSRPAGVPRPIIVQHNPILDARQNLRPDYPLISDAELDRLQDDFVRAAELAAAAGFDGVDIKACHGYLVSELLAAFTRKGSRYGVSFENRTRFLLEVVAQIRAQLPDLIITSRISLHDGPPYPFGFGTCGTWGTGETCGTGFQPVIASEDLTEPLELARNLHTLDCLVLNVSVGNPYYNPHFGRPHDLPLAGAAVPPEHPLIGVARLLRLTAEVQHALPTVPIVGTGYSWLRHLLPNVAAGAIARGDAALVGLGRQALAYPDCVYDLAKYGRLDRNKACNACSGCSQIMRDGGHAGCRVHDCEIYADEYRRGRARAAAADAHLKDEQP